MDGFPKKMAKTNFKDGYLLVGFPVKCAKIVPFTGEMCGLAVTQEKLNVSCLPIIRVQGSSDY
jgi:hypothetical protein